MLYYASVVTRNSPESEKTVPNDSLRVRRIIRNRPCRPFAALMDCEAEHCSQSGRPHFPMVRKYSHIRPAAVCAMLFQSFINALKASVLSG